MGDKCFINQKSRLEKLKYPNRTKIKQKIVSIINENFSNPEEFKNSSKLKQDNSIVTQVDIEVSKLIKEQTEEEVQEGRSRRRSSSVRPQGCPYSPRPGAEGKGLCLSGSPGSRARVSTDRGVDQPA